MDSQLSEQPATHWVGPYGVMIPNEITSVGAGDRRNILCSNGGVTEMTSIRPYTEEEYKKRYANYNPGDNMWYYKFDEGEDPLIVTHMTFEDSFDEDINDRIPFGITHVSFGSSFKGDLRNCLPSTITHLIFRDCTMKKP